MTAMNAGAAARAEAGAGYLYIEAAHTELVEKANTEAARIEVGHTEAGHIVPGRTGLYCCVETVVV